MVAHQPMSAVWHAHIVNTNEYVIKSLASHSDEFCASGPARHLWLEWIRRTAGEKGKDGQLLRYKYSVISEVCKAGIFTRSHDCFSPQKIKQYHNQVANSNNILISLDHFDVNNNYQTSCMQLSFTHSHAKFIHLILIRKEVKLLYESLWNWVLSCRSAAYFVTLNVPFMNGSDVIKFLCLTLRFPWSFNACYTVYHKLTVLLVYLYPIFPPISHCAFLQNGLLFLL